MLSSFLKRCLMAGSSLLVLSVLLAEDRPNILWITSEDNGPHMGCYGDEYASTPNLDALAAKGLIYQNAWSTAPVCAPARTTLISGVYPPSTGGQHMRSMTPLPSFMKMYPQYLRSLGYYCTNNSKKDYNLEEKGKVWDESSRKAHWKNREPGQPFFAVFNITISHESQIRRRPHKAVHDPAKVRVPSYHPDTPEVKQDWAQYHDKMSEMDATAGKYLRELREAGVEDDTVVFYYGDHGSGMPRSKRWPYNSGLRVPLIVHVPEKYKHLAPSGYQAGGDTDRLVGFIDMAPTLLSIVGMTPPEHMQGNAFMGRYEADPVDYQFGFRGRMDERYDLVRSVRDKRYIYIRNYMPHRIYGQYIQYMFQTPTTRVWKQMYDEGKLKAPQTYFWEEKPAEELYDLDYDPDEVKNLVESPSHRAVLKRFRKVHQHWVLETRDLGFLPEGEIHARGGDKTPYEMGQDRANYNLEAIFETAQMAAGRDEVSIPGLLDALKSDDSAIRYWGALGFLIRGESAVHQNKSPLLQALKDESPYVRAVAGEALGRFTEGHLDHVLETLVGASNMDEDGVFPAMYSLNALQMLGGKAVSVRDQIKALPRKSTKQLGRIGGYVPRLLEKLNEDLRH
ncbi:sulfatase-like hydrolase/transferase [Verrucomicrobia bacterium]|nr:sulfatase-like hydrolase/transferase [Verrucomicrobiota bacterium]